MCEGKVEGTQQQKSRGRNQKRTRGYGCSLFYDYLAGNRYGGVACLVPCVDIALTFLESHTRFTLTPHTHTHSFFYIRFLLPHLTCHPHLHHSIDGLAVACLPQMFDDVFFWQNNGQRVLCFFFFLPSNDIDGTLSNRYIFLTQTFHHCIILPIVTA